MYNKDYIRIGADNQSDDYRYLTKAVINVTGLRTDDTPYIGSISTLSKTGVEINIYNTGWCDLKNVTIESDPDANSYQNLKHPERFKLDLDVMEHGQLYVVGELSFDELKGENNNGAVGLRCKVKGESDYYRTVCTYSYNPVDGKLYPLGKGGNIRYRLYNSMRQRGRCL